MALQINARSHSAACIAAGSFLLSPGGLPFPNLNYFNLFKLVLYLYMRIFTLPLVYFYAVYLFIQAFFYMCFMFWGLVPESQCVHIWSNFLFVVASALLSSVWMLSSLEVEEIFCKNVQHKQKKMYKSTSVLREVAQTLLPPSEKGDR